MELKSLRYFVAVAEELHFGRAARRMRVSQPPVSQQIKKLEEETGCRLFNRTQRRVGLTHAGQTFLDHVRPVIAALHDAVDAAKRAQRGEIGRLVIGFFHAATYTLLPVVLQEFRRRAPGVELALRGLSIREVRWALEEGRIHVGFLRPPVGSVMIESEVLLKERFVLAVPAKNPLARVRRIALASLASQPFVMFTAGRSPLYAQIMNACHEAGFSPRVALEATHPDTVIGLVRAGAGIALLPETVRSRGARGVVFRRVSGPLPQAETALAWRRSDDSPLVRMFTEVAREAVRKNRQALQPRSPLR